jgi:MFS family permease
MSVPVKAAPQAWLVWGAAVFAYLVSVTQRTSFGVAGLEATERYDAGASILATFSVVQLVVYAGMQIPVGALVDRWGSRLMIGLGAVLMTAGQLVLAFSHEVAIGFLGRILVGAGDAMTFVSVMRLLPTWFPPRLNPIMSQLTASVGQLGQLVSLVPFAALLGLSGWTRAFLGLAALSFLACAVATLCVRNRPATEARERREPLPFFRSIREAWAHPGTRLGFWTHWSCAFATNVFLLSWGYPFLVSAQGLSPDTAAVIMALFVVVAIVFGPVVGTAVARFPLRRSNLVMLVVGAAIVAWAVVLLWPGRAPVWLLVVLALCVAAGGPTSMVAFDYTRTENPPHLAGAATGLANVGSFTGGLIAIWAIGVCLDLAKSISGPNAELYSLTGFRLAFLVLFVIYAVGITGFLVERKRTRATHDAVEPLYRALRRRLGR